MACREFATPSARASAQAARPSPGRIPSAASAAANCGAAVGTSNVAALRQVHGDRVVPAEEALAGQVQADAMFTRQSSIALLGQSADCPIVLLADVESGTIGMAHASWRCTVARLTFKLIEALCQGGACKPAQLVAGISPSAGPCCYQVGADTKAAAVAGLGENAASFFISSDGGMNFDLWSANIAQMVEAGMCRHNIQVAGVCTICDDRFYSVRREGSSTGRFGALIARQ